MDCIGLVSDYAINSLDSILEDIEYNNNRYNKNNGTVYCSVNYTLQIYKMDFFKADKNDINIFTLIDRETLFDIFLMMYKGGYKPQLYDIIHITKMYTDKLQDNRFYYYIIEYNLAKTNMNLIRQGRLFRSHSLKKKIN